MAKKKVDDTPESIEAKRKAIFADMMPDCQNVATELEKRQQSQADNALMTYYDMGAILKDVVSRPAVYGEEAVDQLASYLPFESTAKRAKVLLVDLKDFAQEYTRDQVVQISKKRMKNGNQITWQHFRYMIKVAQKNERNKLWAMVREHSLSSLELQNVINAEYEVKNERKGCGRKPQKPVSPLAGLQTTLKKTFELYNYLQQRTDVDVLQVLENAPPKEISEKHLAKLEEVEIKLVELKDQVENTLSSMVVVKRRVDQILRSREDDAQGDDDPEVAEYNDDEDDEPAEAPIKKARKVSDEVEVEVVNKNLHTRPDTEYSPQAPKKKMKRKKAVTRGASAMAVVE